MAEYRCTEVSTGYRVGVHANTFREAVEIFSCRLYRNYFRLAYEPAHVHVEREKDGETMDFEVKRIWHTYIQQ